MESETQVEGPPSFRRRVYLALNPREGMTLTSRLLIWLILAATALTIIETEPSVSQGHERFFAVASAVIAVIFLVEYAFRLWSAPECGRSRMHYALSPWSIIDIVVIVASLLPALGLDLLFLRMLRALRMVSLAKLGRYSGALNTLHRAVSSRASHLLVSFAIAAVFLIFSATLMFWIEGDGQPEQFGSIPRALWWSVATMTTVGYGDVVPQTNWGRLIAGLVSLGGIVLIAIPTGIMAAAFSDELRQDEERRLREEAAAEADPPHLR